MLVGGADLAASPDTGDYLAAHGDAIREVHIAGGHAAVSDAVAAAVAALLE